MRTIVFYKTASGTSPVQQFLDTLSDKQVEKILWVLKLIQEMDIVPSVYFKYIPTAWFFNGSFICDFNQRISEKKPRNSAIGN
jgi:hypothetical protein